MTFDFGSLKRPGAGSRELEPRALLRSLPVREGAINDLWDGQAQALTQWHEKRGQQDNLILLNTGAGKSVVGLIIAESLRRELNGNVVYVCPTNDLVRQVAGEASKIGVPHTTRMEGQWSNDLYELGQGVAITNYQALFTAYSTFRGEKTPKAIIFDDAHVAEGVLRDQLTLRITKQDNPDLFRDLKHKILRHERDAGYHAQLDQVFSGASAYSSLLASPVFGQECSGELDTLFQPHQRAGELGFKLAHLMGKWSLCAVCVSEYAIEISPPALPSLKFSFLEDPSVRKVYLSATFDQAVDFARAFGKEIADPIRPNVDAGNGERLILFAGKLTDPADPEEPLVVGARGIGKVVIAVPNGKKGERWHSVAGAPPQDFSAAMDAFRKAASGAILLIARYDGIDLPQDTCRQMVLDGVPRGVSLIEKYSWEYLNLQNDLRSKIATRVTQLFGRIIRGRVDHGCFYILSRDLNIWLRDSRNLALLPDLLAGQVQLGEFIHEQLGIDSVPKAIDLAKQVLNRDEGWIQFYRDWLNDQSIAADVKARMSQQQGAIKDVALAWVRLWSALWKGDEPTKIARLRTAYEGALLALAPHDSRGAGWAGLWLGASYLRDGEQRHAQDHFSRARGQLLAPLPLPRAQLDRIDAGQSDASPMGSQFLELFGAGVIEANRKITRDDRALSALTADDSSTREFEEALRLLGERLGFHATRPDNDLGAGPDVLWESQHTGTLIAFEAKTEKTTEHYNKADVGQALNHAEWLRTNYSGKRVLGVVLLGAPAACTAESSPSAEIYHLQVQRVRELLASYQDLRTTSASIIGTDRIAQAARLGLDDEWSIESIWTRLAPSNF